MAKTKTPARPKTIYEQLARPLPAGDGQLQFAINRLNEVLGFAREDRGKFSIGGMATKLQAVKSAVDSGIETHIANGRHPERLQAIADGEGDVSTRFTATKA